MVRRLAAILAADVAGYSRLMEADENGTLTMLKAHLREFIDPTIAEYRGRIVKLMGDGILVEFASVVDAVGCAVEIQRGMAGRNSSVEEGWRIQFRIGVHLGDIIVEGDDIYGDGVNVAARLEKLAETGGVCFSQQVHDQVETKLNLVFKDVGEQQVKNLTRPIRVWRWVADVPPWADAPAANDLAQPFLDKPAIAVLPFTNLSADPEQEYFSDGLTEDIITALTHWRSFPVIARNSCFAYKNKAVDVKQAARELGAQYVLEGSVRKASAFVRIGAQLIDGATGHHVWAERYDRELADIFEIQDDIVQRITALVAPELAKAELKRLTSKRAEDLDAWDLCLRGMALLHERTREGNGAARELFLRAVAIRPDYSDAYAGLAMSHNMDILIEATENRMVTATQAMEAAQKAIECDEASSWAHHELSTAYQWLDRTDDALAEARIAVDLNPNDAYALHALGNKSDLAGAPDGIAFMEKAQKLNPADARLHPHLTFLARAYVNIGNDNAAVERARQAIRRRPDYSPAYYILALALGKLGELDEARAALAKCDELSPGFVQSRRNWQPYAHPSSNERLLEALALIHG